MRHLKFMLVALVITMSTLYANPERSNFEEILEKTSISYEIEKLLRNSQLVIEEDFIVTIIFEVNESKRIEIRTITSPNKEVNTFLEKRLQNHKLKGKGWFSGKIYELPVKVKAGSN